MVALYQFLACYGIDHSPQPDGFALIQLLREYDGDSDKEEVIGRYAAGRKRDACNQL
jgi:hypothetical protein